MAEDDKQQPRRVKVTDAAAHRTGARRAAIKPHKRSKDAAAKQVVSDYLAGLKAGALSQTYWGETLTKNAVALRTNFGLAANDELFLRLRHAIKREHLYLDPSLDRQKIMDIFQLSRHRVGAAFAQGSEFASLSDFIRDCRLEYSCNLLVTRPDLSIKEVAAKSGFNYASNYSSDFKNRYTMTPSNYRELKAKK